MTEEIHANSLILQKLNYFNHFLHYHKTTNQSLITQISQVIILYGISKWWFMTYYQSM